MYILFIYLNLVFFLFTFIIRRDWEGSDVSRFSLANTIWCHDLHYKSHYFRNDTHSK